MSRQFLITKFVCHACGANLNLSYDKKRGQYAEGEPTGADMVESVISIEPCATCLRPLRELSLAIKALHKREGEQ